MFLVCALKRALIAAAQTYNLFSRRWLLLLLFFFISLSLFVLYLLLFFCIFAYFPPVGWFTGSLYPPAVFICSLQHRTQRKNQFGIKNLLPDEG